jgi:hypothetical protein
MRAGELARRAANAALEQRAARARSRAGDPFWNTSGGANVQRWVERAYDCALAELRERVPEPGRNAQAYLEEIAARVRTQRSMGPDLDDEAWWSSTIDEAASIIGQVARRFSGSWVGGDVVASFGGRSIRRGDVVISHVDKEVIVRHASRETGRVRLDATLDHLLVSPDGTTAFAHDRRNLHHIDLATGKVTRLPYVRGDSYQIASCATSIAIGGSNDDVVCRYAWSGEALAPIVLDHPHPLPEDAESDYFGVSELALSPDGRMLAVNDSGEREHDVHGNIVFLSESATRLYDLERGVPIARIPGGFYRGSLLFANDERLVTPSEILRTSDLSTLARFGHAFSTGATIPHTSWVVLWSRPRLVICDFMTAEPVIDLATTLAPDDEWLDLYLYDLHVDPEGREISASLASDLRLWALNR